MGAFEISLDPILNRKKNRKNGKVIFRNRLRPLKKIRKAAGRLHKNKITDRNNSLILPLSHSIRNGSKKSEKKANSISRRTATEPRAIDFVNFECAIEIFRQSLPAKPSPVSQPRPGRRVIYHFLLQLMLLL